MKNIVTPLIYNQVEYSDYGVHKKTGEIYSKKRGEWEKMESKVSGKGSPYPKLQLSVNGKKKSIQTHIAVHETLNPTLPLPPDVTEKEWRVTPNSVKHHMRRIYEVNHIDHVHTNYNPKNLEWVTKQQNVNAYQKFRRKKAA